MDIIYNRFHAGAALLFLLCLAACNFNSSLGTAPVPDKVCTKFYATTCSELRDEDYDGEFETEYSWNPAESRSVRIVMSEDSLNFKARYDTVFLGNGEYYAVDSVYLAKARFTTSFDLHVVITDWNQSNRIITRGLHEGNSLYVIFEGRYGDDDVKDMFVWKSVGGNDTTISGFGLYTYNDDGSLSTETQWDLQYNGTEIRDTVIQLIKLYDDQGILVRQTEIFDGSSAFTEEYNSAGNIIKNYFWLYSSDPSDFIQIDTVFHYYNEADTLAFQSTYSGSVIKDSTRYDNRRRPVEKWEYLEGLLWRYSFTEYANDAGTVITQKIYRMYDESGNQTKAEWLDSGYYLTHVQTGDSPRVTCQEPLSRVECNTG